MEKLSIIIPITEKYDDIIEIYREYKDALSKENINCEIIFVVDGGHSAPYRDLLSMKNDGEKFTIIKHAKTFGEATAIASGFENSSGDMIMTLPAYHQIEAFELKRIVESLKDCDMVTGKRWPRKDSKLNQFQTKLFHKMVGSMTGVYISDIGCGVRLMKREVLEEIKLYGDLHRFLPILADKQGFKIKEVELQQSSREKPVRTYSPGVYLRRLIDLLTVFFLVKFTKKPLRFFGLAGTVILIPGLLITFYLLWGRILGKFGLSDRPLFLLGILLIVLGIQIFAIGLVGEIIIFTHARELKEYKIEEIIN